VTPKSQSVRYGEMKSLDHTGIRNPTPRSFSPYPVAISTELPRLYSDLLVSIYRIQRFLHHETLKCIYFNFVSTCEKMTASVV
jgi:hypothetical protein